MGTSYDPTTYLNQQATTAPFVSREASAAERLRSSRVTVHVVLGDFNLSGFRVYQEVLPPQASEILRRSF